MTRSLGILKWTKRRKLWVFPTISFKSGAYEHYVTIAPLRFLASSLAMLGLKAAASTTYSFW
ncbi:hypothetical protein ED146_23070 [Escherichia coli]|nr:hypothetical protein [Escherichia coli]